MASRTIMGVLDHIQISLTMNTYAQQLPALEHDAARHGTPCSLVRLGLAKGAPIDFWEPGSILDSQPTALLQLAIDTPWNGYRVGAKEQPATRSEGTVCIARCGLWTWVPPSSASGATMSCTLFSTIKESVLWIKLDSPRGHDGAFSPERRDWRPRPRSCRWAPFSITARGLSAHRVR
jgi:hypothetical protein